MANGLSPARKGINRYILAMQLIPLWLLADFGLSVAAHKAHPAVLVVPVLLLLWSIYIGVTHWQRPPSRTQ
ncbi:hypothetical protein C1Y63_04995 [Corynebacterium sp. 13CS0277]|uniref:hypothetical protein n=1 Tax=Corynebacterium sp. 13CS0277 TaxID=2071994 RepID=UPI000D042E70|nr:hypothetical protein [Corynebacterium sp. 13CS0277]PRQ11768.1 hypothetical protein C1Y63_04995 [Corynebacterium sp. 13CS0277]